MIFFTSACDLPQKEQRVMRDDLAMVELWKWRLSSVEGGLADERATNEPNSRAQTRGGYSGSNRHNGQEFEPIHLSVSLN
jgi:hypothetical protein